MNKPLLIIASFSFAALAFAAELPVNGTFQGAAIGAELPKDWLLNTSIGNAIGVTEVVPGKEDNSFALAMKTTTRETPVYTLKAFPASTGQTLKISAEVEGKGPFHFACYFYNGSSYLGTTYGQYQISTGTRMVSDTIKITDFKGEKATTHIRLAIEALPKADLIIRNFKAELLDQSEK